jgi:hypothetical protein
VRDEFDELRRRLFAEEFAFPIDQRHDDQWMAAAEPPDSLTTLFVGRDEVILAEALGRVVQLCEECVDLLLQKQRQLRADILADKATRKQSDSLYKLNASVHFFVDFIDWSFALVSRMLQKRAPLDQRVPLTLQLKVADKLNANCLAKLTQRLRDNQWRLAVDIIVAFFESDKNMQRLKRALK